MNGYSNNPLTTFQFSEQPNYELYVGSPEDANKAEALYYHIETRNLIAFAVGKPLVGSSLSLALLDLLNRIGRYRMDKQQYKLEVLEYMEAQGYLNVTDSVEHSLALLNFAESCKLERLWKIAFAHCVGMEDRLKDCQEYEHISHETRTLIMRSRSDMDVRINSVNNTFATFFDDESPRSVQGWDRSHRMHCELFRSFLHSFYIEKHGFWPPADLEQNFATAHWIILSMYAEFRNLYEYLVDNKFTRGHSNMVVSSDSLDILQSILALDKSRQSEPLHRPLPRLPQPNINDIPERAASTNRKRSSRWRKDSSRSAESESSKTKLIQLARATNRIVPRVLDCPLVRRYAEFEQESCFESSDSGKISPVEGRKVRWVLIYTIVQTLASIVRTPAEVEYTATIAYPLCCKLPNLMPWEKKDGKIASGIGIRTEGHMLRSRSSASMRTNSTMNRKEVRFSLETTTHSTPPKSSPHSLAPSQPPKRSGTNSSSYHRVPAFFHSRPSMSSLVGSVRESKDFSPPQAAPASSTSSHRYSLQRKEQRTTNSINKPTPSYLPSPSHHNRTISSPLLSTPQSPVPARYSAIEPRLTRRPSVKTSVPQRPQTVYFHRKLATRPVSEVQPQRMSYGGANTSSTTPVAFRNGTRSNNEGQPPIVKEYASWSSLLAKGRRAQPQESGSGGVEKNGTSQTAAAGAAGSTAASAAVDTPVPRPQQLQLAPEPLRVNKSSSSPSSTFSSNAPGSPSSSTNNAAAATTTVVTTTTSTTSKPPSRTTSPRASVQSYTLASQSPDPVQAPNQNQNHDRQAGAGAGGSGYESDTTVTVVELGLSKNERRQIVKLLRAASPVKMDGVM
ncbi:MAG: hypothetical protein Q9227_005343 [Pyrenula ochraceoflavens]